MKVVDLLKIIAGHICIICSISLMVIQILDWFNPLMNFMGNSMFLLYALCAASVFLGVCEIYLRKPTEKQGEYGAGGYGKMNRR